MKRVTTHVGIGHAAVVTCTRFSADGNLIVTSDASGGVFVWEFPQGPQKDEPEPEVEEKKSIVATPKSEAKEEDIRDLPSVRSSGGDSKRSIKEDDCNCLSQSVIICTKNVKGDCEPVRKNSTRSICSEKSMKSIKSQHICESEKNSSKASNGPKSKNGSVKGPDCGCSVKSCSSIGSKKSKN
ncbi:hypothetical protein NQ314_017391 [Rhamnusium bicolor]|uniref:Uncharacterized protein n=1 Tax=Rhamnusium bicolor TaxID=1586634 RepID=A0AAV8WUP4_9CUCU|nr:hypothetical protein NQ314_017391 [Rhamnusium bicolor]